jgi:hypothetical protein
MLRAQHAANSNASYQQLRGLLPGDDVIAVKNLELRRDAATLTFSRGGIAFYGDVNGKVTGAVFKGDGHLHITPPTIQERHNLSIFIKSEEFDEDFDEVVLRFTDETAAELRRARASQARLIARPLKSCVVFCGTIPQGITWPEGTNTTTGRSTGTSNSGCFRMC